MGLDLDFSKFACLCNLIGYRDNFGQKMLTFTVNINTSNSLLLLLPNILSCSLTPNKTEQKVQNVSVQFLRTVLNLCEGGGTQHRFWKTFNFQVLVPLLVCYFFYFQDLWEYVFGLGEETISLFVAKFR